MGAPIGHRPVQCSASFRKMASACRRFVIWRSGFLFFGTRSLVLGSGRVSGRVRVRLRGRFRCQLIIDSWLPWQDPPGPGTGCRGTTDDNVLKC